MSGKILLTLALTLAAGTGLAQSNPGMRLGARPSTPVESRMAMLNGGFENEASAKAAIEAAGYKDVRNLRQDPVGNWVADAERGDVEIAIVLQINGSEE